MVLRCSLPLSGTLHRKAQGPEGFLWTGRLVPTYARSSFSRCRVKVAALAVLDGKRGRLRLIGQERWERWLLLPSSALSVSQTFEAQNMT